MTTSLASAAPGAATGARRHYTLLLLTFIYALNFLDRTIFNVLIEPIKKEFHLSDTAIGLLAGFGFVLPYSALGMPVARFADRANRRNANYASSVWISPFLARVHHLSSGEIGTYAGTFKGLFGIAGMLAGAFATERLTRRDERWLLWAPAVMSGLAGPIFALCMLTTSFPVTILSLGLFSAAAGFHLGPIFSLAQTVAKTSLRAFAAAILLLTATLFGQGLGPLVVGALNDALKASDGVDAIRNSMLSVSAASTLGALIFLLATPYLKRDTARAAQP